MARSNLAYQQPERRQNYRAEPIPRPRPALRTIEGQGRKTAARPKQASWVQTLIVMSALVVVVLATTSVARVSIANATVQMLQTSEQTQASIDQARAVGLELEVKHSIYNNPNRIQDTAAALGILPAGQPETVSAVSGFTPGTIAWMQAAAEASRATEYERITAGLPAEPSRFKAATAWGSAAGVASVIPPEEATGAEVDAVDDLAAYTEEADYSEYSEYTDYAGYTEPLADDAYAAEFADTYAEVDGA